MDIQKTYEKYINVFEEFKDKLKNNESEKLSNYRKKAFEIFQKLYAALMDINDLFLLKCSYPLIKYI